ncbi:MAG: amidohydrolase [Kordiimonadales bacterium]|nr:MAG: amidohydrolase [Kordiimonadales bacterium]
MSSVFDPEGTRLPIKVDSTSNGEFAPEPLPERQIIGNAEAHKAVSEAAKRTGASRRNFLTSVCGAAATLAAFNAVNAKLGHTGGAYALDAEAPFDKAAALNTLGKNEFIFDVQGHFVNPEGSWLEGLPDRIKPLSAFRGANTCVAAALSESDDGRDYLTCLNADSFVKDVFLDSDTDMMVLTFVPSAADREPLTISEAEVTRKLIDSMEGNHRLLVHGRVNPNQAGDTDRMEMLAKDFNVSAFKTYTQWGPDGNGFSMASEDVGIPFIERARSLGVKNIAIHKGLPFSRTRSYEFSLSDDIGIVAAKYPDMNFLIYHSGFDQQVTENEFKAGSGKAGVDSLIQSLIDNGIGKHSNVYAELGSTWRFLMRDPDQAAHVMGKLMKYMGEDNILWGTDSIWYGSPQDQILAFRSFQISDEFQQKYGYAPISATAKAKIFGLNGAGVYGIKVPEVIKHASQDVIANVRQLYAEAPDPHFNTYGPKNRREFMAFLRTEGEPR